MIKLVRTGAENQDFVELVRFLDAELAERDGDTHAFYDQFNKISKIKCALVAYENEKPLGCGAMREYQPSIMEVKRMYVLPKGRKKGIATSVLNELEKEHQSLLKLKNNLQQEFKL